ncbi:MULTISPECIES: hypothetical protein [Thalassobaculum]|uniref:Uncharacterized protein n=1 Tax=Thalassobaculum litoreum DSM 18839 TaxID=1123362 RepID=A0A8G2BEP1_9PROT|nr:MULTISPECIES: hypothetical protein [Thalassobaculum]SDF09952.1 hypothetical protein SAMN05660686_00242 [Thalassobaculum litoreum DSM 18839]
MDQMNAGDYERLLKLINMLGSDSDGEVLNATTAINRLLNAHGLAWSDILLPRKLLPVRANAPEEADAAAPVDPETVGPPPLGQATPQQMYDLLLASGNVSVDAKRDIRRLADAIKGGRLTPSARGELQTMYNYAILRRTRI